MEFLASFLLSALAVSVSAIDQVRILEAKATLDAPPIYGVLTFTQLNDTTVTLTGQIQGLSSGLYGFHVHESGDLSGGCTTALAHFDLYNHTHAAPNATIRHIGDLGNIQFGTNNISVVSISDSWLSLNGPHSIVGRAIMLHAEEDDLGLGNTTDSLITGNAGARVACAVIGVSREEILYSSASLVQPGFLFSLFALYTALFFK